MLLNLACCLIFTLESLTVNISDSQNARQDAAESPKSAISRAHPQPLPFPQLRNPPRSAGTGNRRSGILEGTSHGCQTRIPHQTPHPKTQPETQQSTRHYQGSLTRPRRTDRRSALCLIPLPGIHLSHPPAPAHVALNSEAVWLPRRPPFFCPKITQILLPAK